ncbi:IS110 family transposase [Streptomyces mirabilis]|uniref:IS110 family transposase n=1 Tax=Streptomyces mirabilis TaxID=68239 RepID=UPI0033BBE15E
MAHCRTAARTYGKSDPIDALAAARAALREPDLPTAHLDDASREVCLLMDHRDDMVAERTLVINRLRWHLHELGPELDPPARSLTQPKQVKRAYARHSGTAPLPVWSGRGNRQLNVALHRIEITQAHFHPEARDYLQRRRQGTPPPNRSASSKAGFPTSSTRPCAATLTLTRSHKTASLQQLDIGACGRDLIRLHGC